jgi:prepilin-type N-terminal cleavage/methylation domain-containing protein
MLRDDRRAFTLIELLVVITIIAILASFAAGAISRAKKASQRISCIHNLKQWGQATHMYAADNQEKLPRESLLDGINTWEMTLAPICKDVWYNALPETLGIPSVSKYAQSPSSQQEFYGRGNIFHCPAARFAPISATYPNFSLAINSKLMMDFEASPGSIDRGVGAECLLITDIKVPVRTALFLDAGIPGEERLCEFQEPYSGQPKAYASQFPGRHNKAGNILFAAGHVATLRGEDVVDMDPASARRGGALYPPEKVIWRHDPELVP